jgi:WYL domain
MHENIEDRLKLIDQCLFFYGYVSRSMLVEYFDIGTATASRALKSYQENWPDNAKLQKGKSGGYFITSNFIPSFKHLAEDGLNLLCNGTITQRLQLKTYGPEQLFEASRLNATTVGCVTRAMVNKNAVKIQYISGTSGYSDRIIHPRYVFQGGGAWYVRAYDELHEEHRTFRFSRIMKSESVYSADLPKDDTEWKEEIILSLAPHTKHPNPEAHAIDLGLSNRPVINVKSNNVVAGFLLTDLRVDCSEYGDLNPFEYPLRLMNREDLRDKSSLSFAPGFKK